MSTLPWHEYNTHSEKENVTQILNFNVPNGGPEWHNTDSCFWIMIFSNISDVMILAYTIFSGGCIPTVMQGLCILEHCSAASISLQCDTWKSGQNKRSRMNQTWV